MLKLVTGENCALSAALARRVGRALAGEDAPQYIVVPRQLTLLTERLLLGELKLRGSFRLRVISPARLCALIFEAAGFPQGVRVDDRGRVMLVRQAIRAAQGLSVYKNADRRRGFADRCARQLEIFVQGGVTPQMLRQSAGESSGMSRMKLNDLAAILEEYLRLISGRYQDGDLELIEAARRVKDAPFVAEAHFWFFGFDFTPPTLNRLIAELSARALGAELFFPLPNDPLARDYDCSRPLERALMRMAAACREAGAELEREGVSAEHKNEELRMLAAELYAYPAKCFEGEARHVHVSYAQDVREECMIAAATARRLAMSGMRYGDIQLLCADLNGYRQHLSEAFRLYDVPLFLSESRPVSRMATAECLLSALRLLERNFRSEDVFALMRTSYMDLSDDEADRLANYAVKRGVDGGRWLRPFVRGSDEEIAELEPLRKRLMEPILSLRSRLKEATALRDQLAALFGFLTDIRAFEKSEALQKRLCEQGMREAAGALSQAWNRIIGALDQMAALMGGEKLSLRELSHCLSESLEAAVVKPLPQSGDAVYAQGMNRMLMQGARALLVLGMSDRAAAKDEGLLTAAQKSLLAEQTGAYLGPDESDAARIRCFYLKAALGMARDELFFSCALSGTDGSAQRASTELELVRQIFPQLRARGGVREDEETLRLLSGAPLAAISRPEARGALLQIARDMPDVRDRLRRMDQLMRGGLKREAIDPASAAALYGRLQTQSITRLERFANCPFSYFIAYGLRPEKIEPFELNRRDEGTFLHAAVNEFLRACAPQLGKLSAEAAQTVMGRIADQLLEGMRSGTPMEDSAAARAEARALRATACRCAQVLAEQMRGSSFEASQFERSFGREDGANQLRAGDVVLEGRIDRVDEWREGNSLRVIDFKLGGKPLNLAGAYHGLQLQLPVYLGAALRSRGARSAGVYFFPLDEGVVNSQSTDPVQVEKERAKAFRMQGLLPEDMDLIRAQTPNVEQVFRARVTSSGALWADVPCADDRGFERLIRHALKKAQEQISAIRAGEAAVQPAGFDRRDGCANCDYRAACLFDARLDAGKVRRLKNYKWNEVLEMLALEDDEKG